MEVVIDLRFPVSLVAPAAARRSLDDLSGAVEAEILADLRLLVSELITNCVRHAGLGSDEWIGLEVASLPDRIRVEVSDPGAELGRGHTPTSPLPESAGWGLHIVNQISDRWGAYWDGVNHFWFEIDIGKRQAATG